MTTNYRIDEIRINKADLDHIYDFINYLIDPFIDLIGQHASVSIDNFKSLICSDT